MKIFGFVCKFSVEQSCKEYFRDIQMKEGWFVKKMWIRKVLLVDLKMAISVLEL